jgi:nickel-dependent lactate racemase
LPDIKKLADDALNNPIDKLPLENRLKPHHKIAILIEDNTRNSPKKVILRILLERLKNLSIPGSNISIIIALGTHSHLDSDEMVSTYGEEVVKNYSIVNHACLSHDLVPVGKLRSGTVVKSTGVHMRRISG